MSRYSLFDSMKRVPPQGCDPVDIESQIAAFFRAGGKIQHIPIGVSGSVVIGPTAQQAKHRESAKRGTAASKAVRRGPDISYAKAREEA